MQPLDDDSDAQSGSDQGLRFDANKVTKFLTGRPLYACWLLCGVCCSHHLGTIVIIMLNVVLASLYVIVFPTLGMLSATDFTKRWTNITNTSATLIDPHDCPVPWINTMIVFGGIVITLPITLFILVVSTVYLHNRCRRPDTRAKNETKLSV